MPSNNHYHVATSKQLLGSKPPGRKSSTTPRPPSTHFSIENKKGQEANTMRKAPVTPTRWLRAESERTVRFSPSTDFGSDISSVARDVERDGAASWRTVRCSPITHRSSEASSVGDSRSIETRSDQISRKDSAIFDLDDRVSAQSARSFPPVSYLQYQRKREARHVRSKEIVAERMLPAAHAWRLQQSQQSSITRPRTGSQPTDVYFSPLDLAASSTCLSEPLSPGSLDARSGSDSWDSQTAIGTDAGSEREVLNLAPTQVDRITTALAESKLLKEAVSKGWWNRIPSQNQPKTHNPLYSHPNSPISSFLPTPKHTGTALADPNLHGAPVYSHSAIYAYGANAVAIGACTFLNLPYGSSNSSCLRVEPPRGSKNQGKSNGCKITIQTMTQILDRTTRKQAYLLVNEYDITASVTEAAVAELKAHVGQDVAVELQSPLKSRQPSDAVDWTALADDLKHACAVTDRVELAVESFRHLTAKTCSEETTALIAQLETLTQRPRSALVLRPTQFHDLLDGPGQLPCKFRAPWASARYCELDVGERGRYMGEVRKTLAREVGDVGNKKERFEIEIDDGRERVGVVPLVQENGKGESVVAWACTFG